jgi:light-regulated signal transduction histidine kinase (bacteriophytochrome)
LILQLNVELRDRAGQLEEANRELETFSYSVSHDLRAPLRHIQGYVEMLTAASAGQLTGEAPRYLATISDASVEMSHLIDDLLEFSRVGRVEFSERRASLDKLVKGVMQSAEWVGQARQVVWRIGPLPEVVGDPSMLRQVFVNLLGNALKYSRDRDPAVIEIGCAGEESGRAILFVRDNGAGFDMQYAHKLFGVFQRLHRTDQFEGTGIGLALVRRIIGRHGGRTWAEGATDHGATFYFTLQPASALQQPTVDPSEMTREQPEERPWTTSKAS